MIRIHSIRDATRPEIKSHEDVLRVLAYLQAIFRADRKTYLSAAKQTQTLMMHYERDSHAIH